MYNFNKIKRTGYFPSTTIVFKSLCFNELADFAKKLALFCSIVAIEEGFAF